MAEIGRISGPLLRENLTRDGVNLRFESNLIYLDVNTHAADVSANPSTPTAWTGNVGIRNPNPAYPLDVQGTTRSNVLLVKSNAAYDAYAEIDDIKLDTRTISTIVGSLEIQAATGTDRVNINSNTKIDANLEVTGNITLGGTINIGDSADDDVVFAGEVKSNIIPDATSTYDLGSAAKAWRFGYFDDILVNGLNVGTINASGTISNDQIEIVGNQIRTYQSNTDLELDTAGTGTIELLTSTNVTGDLTVTGDVNIGGNLTLGNTTFDTITVVADFTSNLIPDASLTYDLGSTSKSWNNLYVENINISGNMYFDQIAIEGNKIRTTQSNADLEFDTAGTGRYVFIGTGGVIMPVGTTAERPTPPQQGMLRFNTDDARFENYNGEEWNRMIHDDDAIAFAIALG